MERYSSFKEKHFVLVHGAWCWYKLKALLENAGFCVTVLDMAAAGINLKPIHELQNLQDYTEPLIKFMEALPNDKKVILVGHSLGGMNISLAMEMFPHKIETAVYLAAFMPDTQHTPSFIVDQSEKFHAKDSEGDFWLDTEFECSGDLKNTPTTMLFGPKFFSKLYHLSPPEDVELAMTLKRPSSFFHYGMCESEWKFSLDKYESVRRVYVVCEEDQGIKQDFQRWMIDNGGVREVKVLKGADHMPMFSMPQKLCDCLVEISQKIC